LYTHTPFFPIPRQGVLFKMRAFVEVRSQHSKGSSSKMFGGPDTYVAVQVVPDGQEPLRCLNKLAAERRGIKIFYVGEGYSKNTGPKSSLGRAIQEAEKIANHINALDELGVNIMT